jgi:hypothetical protein
MLPRQAQSEALAVAVEGLLLLARIGAPRTLVFIC